MEKRRIFRAILRQDLASFIQKVFYSLNPSTIYENNWHIDLIAQYLEEVTKGNIKRLIINVPPRSLKSICISVAWPAWLLGRDPTKRIIAASFAQSLSIKHSLDSRFIMNSDWYQEIFPKSILSKKQNQKSKYLTTENGFRMSVSVGGMVTGEGGDFLIIDDPHNPSHIHSKKRRNQVIEWYEQSFATRLNNKQKGAIILVMQRLHSEDLAGYLAKSGDWEMLKIPLTTSEKLMYQIAANEYIFEAGKAFHPIRYADDTINKIEKELGFANFAAQYLQEPINLDYALLDISDIHYYDKNPSFEYFIESWDTAIKTGENSDYSVCTIWGIATDNYYLIDVFRKKLTYPELKNKIIYLSKKYMPKFILIEDHASGSSIIQDLKSDGMFCFVPIRQKIDKITRFASIIEMFQNGQAQFPKDAIFMRDVISELCNFPKVKHDDIVDSISQFLNFMKGQKLRNNLRIRSV